MHFSYGLCKYFPNFVLIQAVFFVEPLPRSTDNQNGSRRSDVSSTHKKRYQSIRSFQSYCKYFNSRKLDKLEEIMQCITIIVAVLAFYSASAVVEAQDPVECYCPCANTLAECPKSKPCPTPTCPCPFCRSTIECPDPPCDLSSCRSCSCICVESENECPKYKICSDQPSAPIVCHCPLCTGVLCPEPECVPPPCE